MEFENLHLALGNATCYTQIPFTVIMNLCLVIIGFTEGAKEVADLISRPGPGGESASISAEARATASAPSRIVIVRLCRSDKLVLSG